MPTHLGPWELVEKVKLLDKDLDATTGKKSTTKETDMTNTADWLDTIAHTARLLPDIVEGQPINVADLHKAAAVCGWITDTPPEVPQVLDKHYPHETPETLAHIGRGYLAAAIQRHQEQQEQA